MEIQDCRSELNDDMLISNNKSLNS